MVREGLHFAWAALSCRSRGAERSSAQKKGPESPPLPHTHPEMEPESAPQKGTEQEGPTTSRPLARRQAPELRVISALPATRMHP